MSLFPDSLWQRYQLKQEIDSNAAIAIDPSTARTVYIRCAKLPDKNSAAVWQHHANLRRSLKHSNIVELIDAFQIDNQFFWVMEYCNAGTLAEFMQAENNSAGLPVAEVTNIGASLCKALETAHKAGHTTAQLSPEKILLHASKAGLVVKVTVFDTPPVINPNVNTTNFDFTTPEQLLGEPSGTAQDVYSLGILLYMLLTGSYYLPPAEDEHARYWQILADQPIPLQNHRSDIPDWLSALVMQTLEKEPAYRPTLSQTYFAFQHPNRRLPHSRNTSLVSDHRSTVNRNWLWMSLGLTSVVLPALFSVLIIWGYFQLTSPQVNTPSVTISAAAQNVPDTSTIIEQLPNPVLDQAVVQNTDLYDGLKIRTEPNRDAPQIGTLSDGDMVKIFEYSNDKAWARIVGTQGQQGWVFVGQYLRISE